MATVLNLYRLIPSDDQQLFTDKCNFNFDAILNMGGGPPGIQGIQGIQGVPGSQGIQGLQGTPGAPGTKWFVENTDPTSFGPTSPAPNEGDYWFDTSTLDVYNYVSGTWTLIGSLTVSGVFKNSTADIDRVIFSNPSPLKSLVLSPVNYGVGSPQAGTYKLKLIGSPGNPVMNFGVLETGNENLAANQSYITVNTVTPGSEYSWELINPTGNVELSGFGTSLDLIKQVSNISKFEFNSNSFKVQLSPSERLMSFYSSPSGLSWHVGGHNAITNTAERILTVTDTLNVGIGDPFNNAVTGDVTAYDFRFDQNNVTLGNTSGDTTYWARWRSKISPWNTSQLNFRHVRSFTDTSGTPWRSHEVRIEHKVDASYGHFIAMGGGASAPGSLFLPSPARSALRFGVGGTANDGYYFAADNGSPSSGGFPRMFMGTPTYIKSNTGTLTGGTTGAKLNVEGYTNGGAANSNFTAIHLNMGQGAGVWSNVGITASRTVSSGETHAGITFQQQDTTGAWATVRPINVNIAAGDDLTAGMRNIITLTPQAETYFWSRSSGTAFMKFQVGGMYQGTQSNPNLQFWPHDFAEIAVADGLTGMKSIVMQPSTNVGGFGDGFVGIGDEFSDPINAGNTLTVGKYYKGRYLSGTVHNGIDYRDFVPFQAVNTTLTAGSVVEAKPQTKFHVYGPTTFGTRRPVLNYSTDVGLLSFTIGRNHLAAAGRSLILGGNGHTTVSGATDAVIVGFSGTPITVQPAFANTVSLAANTYASTSGPFTQNSTSLAVDGDMTAGQPYYSIVNAPVLSARTDVYKGGVLVIPMVGEYVKVMTLEARNVGATSGFFAGGPRFDNIHVGLEFHVRNAFDQTREIGSISGMYYEPTPGTQRGQLSFNTNIAGTLYEVANFSAAGLTFSGDYAKIQVKSTATPGGVGKGIYITAGDAAQTGGAAIGGGVAIDAGAGGTGGANGTVVIGLVAPPSGVAINTQGGTGIINMSGVTRCDVDYTTGTDTPGWTYAPLGPYDFKVDNQGNFSFAACDIKFLTSTNLFDKPHFSYKIIGKTIHLMLTVQLGNSGWGLNSRTGMVLLPAAIQGIIKNYYTPTGNKLGSAAGDSIGWMSNDSTGFPIRLAIRKYSDGGFPNQWVLVIDSMSGSAMGTGYDDAAVRGQITFELV